MLRKILFGISAFLITQLSFSQGCSDAGFCTMGSMSPDQNFGKKTFKLRSLEVSFFEGQTNLTPKLRGVSLNGSFAFNETSVQVKAPIYGVIKGNLGTVSPRLGDLSISATRAIFQNDKITFSGTFGAKITTGNGDIQDERGRVFPMYYQINLGSHDLVLGGSLVSKKWMLATGVQIPIIHTNKNDFSYEAWSDYPSPSYLRKHSLATDLRRGSDAMLRIERDFRYSKFNLNIGLLNIYRLNKDQILNRETGEYLKLDKTTGFAITALAGLQYKITTSSSVNLSYGHKIIDREVNPDGLTRKHVISIGYQFKF